MNPTLPGTSPRSGNHGPTWCSNRFVVKLPGYGVQ
jgi:hypothetical protein